MSNGTNGAGIAVTVKLFATLRQQAGWSEQVLQVPSETTLGVYAAVNQSYAQMDRVLAEGDVVAIFPPVSGGTK